MAIPIFQFELSEEDGRYKKTVIAPDNTSLGPIDFELTGSEAHSSILQEFHETGGGAPNDIKNLGVWLYGLLFDRDTERLYDQSLGT